MTFYRLLLFSDRSPRSTWNLANRIERQVPGTKICGIVLKPIPADSGRFRATLQRLFDLFIGIVHAFPTRRDIAAEFDSNDLIRECHRRELPLLVAEDFNNSEVSNFVQDHPADLGVVIGTSCLHPGVLASPLHGLLRVRITTSASDGEKVSVGASASRQVPSETSITVQSEQGSKAPLSLVSVRLPVQPYDTPLGIALKTELVSNDIIVQMISSYSTGNMGRASEEANAWVHEMLPKCPPATDPDVGRSNAPPQGLRSRQWWKLCCHTVLLCSPYVIVRNWRRRRRGQFPLIILFHHLVSDRPHRMGMSTEVFFHQVRFLQRYYRVVSLSEALESLRSGSLNAPTVVLTFDDGYEENFLTMRAVTENTGIPAVMFVCSKAVTAREEFQHDHEDGQTGFRSLGWNQIRYWQRDSVEFGSHTRSHFNCGSSDVLALRDEIVGSRDEMERHLRRPVRLFAFPWGMARNMSSTAIEIATSSYDHCVSALEGESYPTKRGQRKIAGRKFLPANRWDLELTLQSIFELAHDLKR